MAARCSRESHPISAPYKRSLQFERFATQPSPGSHPLAKACRRRFERKTAAARHYAGAEDPHAKPNKGAKGWLPFVVQGHVESDGEGEVWLHADQVIQLGVGALDALNSEFEQAVVRAAALTTADRARRLAEAPRFPRRFEVVSYVFERNPDVVAEVLSMAQGRC